MERTLDANFCAATSSSQSPSSFLFTDATPVCAEFCAVTSADAVLSFLRPVHTLIPSSTSMDEDEMDGVEVVGALS